MKTALFAATVAAAFRLYTETVFAQSRIISRGSTWRVNRKWQKPSRIGTWVQYRGGISKYGWFARIFIGGEYYVDAALETRSGDQEVFSWVLHCESRSTGTRNAHSQRTHSAGRYLVQKSTGNGWTQTTQKYQGCRWCRLKGSWPRLKFTK